MDSIKRGCMVFISLIVFILLIQPLLGCCEQCSCEGCGCEGCGCESCGCSEDSDDDGSDSSEDDTVTVTAPEPAEAEVYEPPQCRPTIERTNGRDDDCDGSIDEEDCGDGIDNDSDGAVDESPPC